MKRLLLPRRLRYNYRYFSNTSPKFTHKHETIIMIHGGAGNIFDEHVLPKLEALKNAIKVGIMTLMKGTAIEAIEQTIRVIDLSESFNTGKGSMLNANGEVEMDSSIMCGDLKSGSVTGVKNIGHPISLSRKVMENTSAAILCNPENLARLHKIEILPPGALVTQKAKDRLVQSREIDGSQLGIVGVVAMGQDGTLAAGTSGGGWNGRWPGKSSDLSRVGCGIYADNLIAAIAVSGNPESIIKCCLSYQIMENIRNGLSPSESIQKGLFQMDMRLHTSGGAIAISKTGEIGFYFNTKRMPWAYHDGKTLHYGSEKGEHNVEPSVIT